MWHRKICLPVVLVAASALAGCAQYSPWSNARPRPVVVSQADLATFNDAISLTESLHYEAAAGKFQQVFDSFTIAGDRKRAAEAMFWLGFCREKQHRSVEARAIYLRLADEYAGTRAAHQADQRLSRLSGGGRRPAGGDKH